LINKLKTRIGSMQRITSSSYLQRETKAIASSVKIGCRKTNMSKTAKFKKKFLIL